MKYALKRALKKKFLTNLDSIFLNNYLSIFVNYLKYGDNKGEVRRHSIGRACCPRAGGTLGRITTPPWALPTEPIGEGRS